ncbi:testis-specific gene 13 protein-like isoform X2 [Acipenser ruthenus]|uniref:testis-specific gene 13 protein-like isoform X2 n=1 Tax=Acipenser ruthenus TaxID=7906 RepID=UPI002740894C|nr:testis-specific gene 13 protein-like isoform X2 [Acipenser ruthenus]
MENTEEAIAFCRSFQENPEPGDQKGSLWVRRREAAAAAPAFSPPVTGTELEPIYEPEEDEGLGNERAILSDTESKEEIPLYIQTLYSFLGKEAAEDFLHPTIEEKTVSPRAKWVLNKTKGFVDCEDIWKILRDNSKSKQTQLDSTIPQALQMSKFENLPTTKYQRFQRQMARYRSRLALMQRASESNQDKTSLIIANNPLLGLNDLEGKSGPMKYLTPGSLNKAEEPFHKPHGLPPLNHHKTQLSRIVRNSVNLKEQGLSKADRKQTNRFLSGERLHACSDRWFSDHYSMKRIRLPPKLLDTKKSGQSTSSKDTPKGKEKEPPAISSRNWEPLTMSAVIETTRTVAAPGQGAFKCGNVPQWTVDLP